MLWIKSKKGILMFGTVIVFFLLMSYAVVVLFTDESEKKLKLGSTLIEIYSAEENMRDFDYYLEKSGEYALLNGLKDYVPRVMEDYVNCVKVDAKQSAKYMGENIWFSDVDCVFDPQKAVKNNLFSIDLHFDSYAGKYLTNLGEGVVAKDFKFDKKLDGDYLVLNGVSNKSLDFSENQKKLVFKKEAEFEAKLKFNFSEYYEVINVVIDEIDCFEKIKNDRKNQNIASSGTGPDPFSCFNNKGHAGFSEVELDEDLLMFKYALEGALFEEHFIVPFAVDLKELRKMVNAQQLAFIT